MYLALVDVVRTEEKLPVQVGLVDGVQVYHLHVLESRLHEVLQQLAACAIRLDKRTKI